MSELEKYIESYFGVTKKEVKTISSFFSPAHLKKNEFFLKSGRYCNTLGFIQEGIIREFLLINEKEVTKWIATKGYFVVDLASFVFHESARWNLQALTDSELYVINKEDYARIGSLVPSWPVLEKMFITNCFKILENRVLNHLSMTAEERYDQLFAFNPEIFNQVPLHYLASMLGMTPETFSRLRNKKLK